LHRAVQIGLLGRNQYRGSPYGIGHGIQALQKLYQQGSKLAGSLYRALAHGLSRAVISVVRGGKALGGFLSGFAGSLLGGFAKGLENVDTITKTIIVAIAGGTASMLGGGKFANGAMSAAFVFMFNENVIKKAVVKALGVEKADSIAKRASEEVRGWATALHWKGETNGRWDAIRHCTGACMIRNELEV